MPHKVAGVLVLTVLVIFGASILSCEDDGNPVQHQTEEFEMLGAWTGIFFEQAVDVTITSSTFEVVMNDTTRSAQVLEFNNSADIFIVRWTVHEEFVDKYQKFKWEYTQNRITNMDTYSAQETLAEAKASNDIAYRTTSLEKKP